MKLCLLLSFLFVSACSVPQARKLTHKKQDLTYRGKVRGYLEVVLVGEIQKSGDYLLKARVVAVQDFTNAQVKWQLPEHVKVLGGDISEERDFIAGQAQEIELFVDAESLKEGDQMFLFVQKKMAGENHGSAQSVVYSTKSEENNRLEKTSTKKKKIIR